MMIKTGVNATFRMKRSYYWLGVGGALGYGTLCVLGVTLALTGPGVRDRMSLTVLFGGLPLLMTGLSLWLLAAYQRQVLTLEGGRLIFQGIFRRTEIGLGDVIAARWTPHPQGGGLVLWWKDRKLTIHLSYYLPDEQARLVDVLRAGLDPAVQIGWNLFAYKTGIRERRTPRLKPHPDEILLRRDRWDRYLIPSMLALGVASLVSWRFTGRPGALALPLALIPGWGVLRTCWPAEGVVLPKLSSARSSPGFLVFLLIWLLIGGIGLFVLPIVLPRLSHPRVFLAVVFVLYVAILLFEAGLEDRRQRLRDQEAADLAAKARGEFEADPEWSV